MNSSHIPVQMLGQSGCKLSFPAATVYMDPYLSNSVQELDAPDLERMVPIPFPPESVSDADWVLITHDHIDHCDPHTLPRMAAASPQARFVGPPPVATRLREWGIGHERIFPAQEEWIDLAQGLRLRAVPAAHPTMERDADGNLSAVGYVLEAAGQLLYFAGDTSAHPELIETLKGLGPIHTAFLPVNEHNFFRGRKGVIGNMSVREAFQLAVEIRTRQVVAVHWDMFAVNDVDPDEIRVVYNRIAPDFSLLLRPEVINLGEANVTIIVRTLNESKYLEPLLASIARQHSNGLHAEVVLVDSGSTDETLDIAERKGCRILHIKREEFSFGRSLNMGCEAAQGDILVMISGHCVPTNEMWLQSLCQPILDGQADYCYGRQVGGPCSQFSECRIFSKYYPQDSKIPQEDIYCNNANSALLRTVWEQHRFDEELTGLEDIELAQRIVRAGGKIAYVAEACVYHHHSEALSQVRRRFEREAIALQRIMPQVHVNLFDTLRYITTSVLRDWQCARLSAHGNGSLLDIAGYRWNQYIGSWKGNRQHRKLSHAEKEKYFFPD